MISQLAGYEPLQNKILMYCLGTPSAAAMKLLCAQIGAKRRDQDDEDENKMTAFRYYKGEIKSNKPRKHVRSYLGWVVREELKLIKNQDPDLRADQERVVKTLSKTYLEIRLCALTDEEENGTPTGVIIRRYIKNLLERGYTLLKDDTIWAKFSCGELISNTYNREPLMRYMKPELFAELTKALDVLTELRSIKNYKNY